MVGDTIAAVATAAGSAGVGVVRVSGPLARAIAKKILGGEPRPRFATFRAFLGRDGECIDQGLGLLFLAPNSFTGEDVLELQGHGGSVVLDMILQRCLELGARPARPGEFSERAFLNGKLDLAQAEAIADLVASSTETAARLSVRSLKGELSRRIEEIVEMLMEARSLLEATLDFPDEELEMDATLPALRALDEAVSAAENVLRMARQGERVRTGFRVIIAGRTNAGKSSLLNALAQSEKAIVTPIPGTTRDLLEVDIEVGGLAVQLIDTAGIRETWDTIEQEGVRRARDRMRDADLILWVYDAVLGMEEEELAELPVGAATVTVRSKVDLARQNSLLVPGGLRQVQVSAVTGEGLDDLRAVIREVAGIDSGIEGAFIARRRHLDALAVALKGMKEAQNTLKGGGPPEIAALDIGAAQKALGEITGQITADDVLGRIFSTFCIGK